MSIAGIPVVVPERPDRSTFAKWGSVGAVIFTLYALVQVGFIELELVDGAPWVDVSFEGITSFFTNILAENPVIAAIPHADLSQLTNDRSIAAFITTFQLAVLGTVVGASAALPLALWSTDFGNPFPWLRYGLRSVNAVIRSIPDLIWAVIFVSAVGVGVLAGWLALIMFSLAVTTKLTADTLDGIDHGPIEAARASGANNSQVLRTAVVPQILPAYASYVLYDFELNLRASAVIGIVGAGGMGARIEFFRSQLRWEEMWGIVVFILVVVIIVEQISVIIRRRLV